MAKYTIHQAKTQFSKLLKKVEEGEEVLIANRDRTVAKLIAVSESSGMEMDFYKGKIKVEEDFDEPVEGFEDYSK
jgi:prevent-host-death family protein